MNVTWLRMVFIVSIAAAGAFIVWGGDDLPAVMATQFGAAGAPVSWMSRGGYQVFMLGLAVGIPILIVALVTWLPGRFPNLVNVPNRGYWFAPERRDASLAYLQSFALILGTLMAAFMAGTHWLLVRTNATGSPQLDTGLLVTMLALFILAESVCVIALVRRFRRPPADAADRPAGR